MNSIWKLHIQETSQWKGVYQEPFLKQGKQGENTEVRKNLTETYTYLMDRVAVYYY